MGPQSTIHSLIIMRHICLCQHLLHIHIQNVRKSGEVPVYKLVLLQILTAFSDVSGHVEKVHHGQAGWMLLIKQRRGRERPRMQY